MERMLASPSQHDASFDAGAAQPVAQAGMGLCDPRGALCRYRVRVRHRVRGRDTDHLAGVLPRRTRRVPGALRPHRSFLPNLLAKRRLHSWEVRAHPLVHDGARARACVHDGLARRAPTAFGPPRPDLYAISLLALYKQHSDPSLYDCDGRELLADTLQVMAFPATWGGYWVSCKGEHHPPDEYDAQDVVQSMLDGEYPDWFVAEYGLPGGGYALRRVWADVVALERLDPFPKQLLVWQLQDAFGGYCSHERVAASAYRGAVLPNPWATGNTDETRCG